MNEARSQGEFLEDPGYFSGVPACEQSGSFCAEYRICRTNTWISGRNVLLDYLDKAADRLDMLARGSR